MTANQNSIVPHLTTALTGPLENLERVILSNQTAIESWFRNAWREVQVPFYASVDIRNAGYKIAPVDTNLFPSGVNNLNPSFVTWLPSLALLVITLFVLDRVR